MSTLDSDQKELDKAFARVQEIDGPTAKEIAAQIMLELKEFADFKFHARQGLRLGDHDSVMITYASVPAGAPELDALNAKTNPKWHIAEVHSPARDQRWRLDGPAPSKVMIEHFSGSIRRKNNWDKANKVVFRAKTGTPEQILRYLVDFFRKNREAFLP
jgi:hypothetical protein